MLAKDPHGHVGRLEDQVGQRPLLAHPHHRQGADVHPLAAEQLPEVGQGADPVLELHHHLGQHPDRLLQGRTCAPGRIVSRPRSRPSAGRTS